MFGCACCRAACVKWSELSWRAQLGVALASASDLTFNWTGFISAMVSNLTFGFRAVWSKKCAPMRSPTPPKAPCCPHACICMSGHQIMLFVVLVIPTECGWLKIPFIRNCRMSKHSQRAFLASDSIQHAGDAFCQSCHWRVGLGCSFGDSQGSFFACAQGYVEHQGPGQYSHLRVHHTHLSAHLRAGRAHL